ncbi:hypothetical protein [Reinekea sp. G2M2-21]|uniref:hypothetical protein n=1 Tax=Reinekea sp. G2M2-21 TaxID=2788942 RepID=UPI0018A8BAAC|nr:hypothetical protein [Reinekea sp. G2M2-21]
MWFWKIDTLVFFTGAAACIGTLVLITWFFWGEEFLIRFTKKSTKHQGDGDYRVVSSADSVNTERKSPKKNTEISLSIDRQKSVVYCIDILDFKDLVELIKPEELSDVICLYQSVVKGCAKKYGGILESYSGSLIRVILKLDEELNLQTQIQRSLLMALDINRKILVLRCRWRELGVAGGLKVRACLSSNYFNVTFFEIEQNLFCVATARDAEFTKAIVIACQGMKVFISEQVHVSLHREFRHNKVGVFRFSSGRGSINVFEISNSTKQYRHEFYTELSRMEGVVVFVDSGSVECDERGEIVSYLRSKAKELTTAS